MPKNQKPDDRHIANRKQFGKEFNRSYFQIFTYNNLIKEQLNTSSYDTGIDDAKGS